MKIIVYNALPEESVLIREEVFVKEQGFTEEFDTVDRRAAHLVAYDDSGVPVGTCRVFASDSDKIYYLGRLAVLKNFRNKGVGAALLSEAESFVRSAGADYIYLHSQVRAMQFYQKCGYLEFGDIELDEGCPHIWMKKQLH